MGIMMLQGERLTQSFTKGDGIVACLNFGSMNCSSYAMKGVSYPFVVLSKSAKIIPVILVGAIRGIYKPERRQYIVAFCITLGLIIFNIEKALSKSDTNSDNSYIFGLILVCMSLTFDGLTQTQTDK